MTFDHCAALVIRNGLNIQIVCVKCDITWNDLCTLQRFVHWEWNLERNFHIRILETIYGIKPYTDCKSIALLEKINLLIWVSVMIEAISQHYRNKWGKWLIKKACTEEFAKNLTNI